MKLMVCDECAGENAGLVLENREGIVRIPFQGIEYVEVLNKKVSFHMEDGTLREMTGALADVEGKLLDRPEFIKTHRSYVVNLHCVKEIGAGFAVTGAGHVPVARQRRAPVREAWLQLMQQKKGDTLQEESGAAKSRRRPDGPWQILLVDDDPAQRRIWADVLREVLTILPRIRLPSFSGQR